MTFMHSGTSNDVRDEQHAKIELGSLSIVQSS